MARKSANIPNLIQALTVPAFERQDADDSPTHLEPLTPTTLVLSLSDIKSYEHNPRHAENPEFDRLKSSIAARRGLTTPLTVTKRPGDERYTIAAGGNSRLQALNELYRETADDTFNRVTCQFEPWESECQVLANHLIENDVRGNITFADKARAIVHWCELHEEAHADELPLTQRQLAEHLGRTGFQVSQTSLSRFLYAAEQLLPNLPRAFESGLGREPIERLIRLRTLAERYWHDTVQATGLEPDTSFAAIFIEVCAAQDCHREDWAHEIFASALAAQIAKALGADGKLVTLDLDDLYRGVPVNIKAPDSQGAAGQRGQAGDDGWVFERERQHLAAQAERQQAREEARAQTRAQREAESPAGQASASVDSIGRDDRPPPEIVTADDLVRWRKTGYAKAERIAASHGLSALLVPCDIGYGFFIEPPEPPPIDDSTNADRSAARSPLSDSEAWIWWWVCACAQQLDPAHLGHIGKRQPTAWLVQLFHGAPQHLPGTSPREALNALVGARDLVMLHQDFLASHWLSDQAFDGY